VSNIPEEFVVDGQLAEQLVRRGVHVHAGDRVQLQLVSPPSPPADGDPVWDAFIGSAGTSGDPGLSTKAKEIVRAEMGR
jgi:hypothetical protein